MIPPNTAQAFIKFMEMVWEGGPLYDRYENAVKTARFAGAVRTAEQLSTGKAIGSFIASRPIKGNFRSE